MKKWKYYGKGYLHIRLMSKEPERFLNLCANHNIPIWDLTAEVSRRLLSGQALNDAMDWMDQQAKEGVKP